MQCDVVIKASRKLRQLGGRPRLNLQQTNIQQHELQKPRALRMNMHGSRMFHCVVLMHVTLHSAV
jgi:hypothetical protein